MDFMLIMFPSLASSNGTKIERKKEMRPRIAHYSLSVFLSCSKPSSFEASVPLVAMAMTILSNYPHCKLCSSLFFGFWSSASILEMFTFSCHFRKCFDSDTQIWIIFQDIIICSYDIFKVQTVEVSHLVFSFSNWLLRSINNWQHEKNKPMEFICRKYLFSGENDSCFLILRAILCIRLSCLYVVSMCQSINDVR